MSDILLYNAISTANKNLRVGLGEYVDTNATLADPATFTSWTSIIPKLSTETGTLCVYDNSVNFNSGFCCLWTVPVGSTKVRFELWGAGAGTGAGMCCSGSPFGATGAYASVIMTAVPGCQYTLCAGAANATQLCCTVSGDVSGCPSYVNGYGLSNYCAMGGCSSLYRMMTMLRGSATGCCRYSSKDALLGGGCICCDSNANYFCFSNSCSSYGEIPRVSDTGRIHYGTSTTGTVYGIPSMYSADCFDTNFYGVWCDQPTMLPNNTVSSICCISYTSGNCCGKVYGGACTGNRCQPGKGGTATHATGGAVSVYGDLGRTGMVRVSWC